MTITELLALHAETCKTTAAIMARKNHDYTSGSADPFANFRMATAIGLTPVQGLLLRMMDKIQRIATFDSKGELKVSGESVDDACNDIVNYAILCKGLLRERALQQPVLVCFESHDHVNQRTLAEPTMLVATTPPHSKP